MNKKAIHLSIVSVFFSIMLFSFQNQAIIKTYKIIVTQTAVTQTADFKTNSLASALAHISTNIQLGEYNEIQILINKGQYDNETVKLNDTNLKAPTTISALYANQKPYFKGSGYAYFMVVAPKQNLFPVKISGLKIGYYNEAISIYVDGVNAYLGQKIYKGHKIENCDFQNIGNKYGPSTGVGYAAVRLQNVQDSEVSSNTFTNIENATSVSLLHAIYIAHFSQNNIIRNNTFKFAAGDWIRIRNQSHDNLIEYNSFEDVSGSTIYSISTWYDKKDVVANSLECPSYRLSVQYNDFKNSLQTFEHIKVSEQQPACQVIPTDVVFNLNRNIDVASGRCEITSFQDCNTFLLGQGIPRLDYLSQPAQSSSSTCVSRSYSYYNSCVKRSLNDYEAYQSLHVSPYAVTIGYFGRGCYVDVSNCPRMGRTDYSIEIDPNTTGYDSESACIARATSWYGSCSKIDASGLRYARTTYIANNIAKESIVANGCIVKANHCPRMGFNTNGIRVDTDPNSQTTADACMARANSWLGSCLVDDPQVNREITMMYYKSGVLVKSRKVAGP